jgi:hypothetical protein
MNTNVEKERIVKTTLIYAVVIILIVVLMLLVVEDIQIKSVAVVLVVLVGTAAILVQWMLIGKKGEQSVENEPVVREGFPTQTGAACEKSGQYHCADHPQRKVTMKVGKRFPPCRGTKKAHSATWILKE